MKETDTPLGYLSQIQDLVDLNDHLNDPEFEEACNQALRCIAKPHIPNPKIGIVIVQLQAYSFQFHLKAATYAGIKASNGNKHKKNAYYAMYHALDDLVDALKIQARYGQ
jgi:hypothetical protein